MSYYLDQPVFICGHRKTGTTLFANMLDGAQDLLVYPDDSGFFYLYYPRYESDKYTYEQKMERIADYLIKEHFQDILTRPQCTQEERKDLFERNQQFHTLVRNFENKNFSTRELLMYFFDSFQKAFYPSRKNFKYWVEKTTSTEIYAHHILEMFPKAKFIHIVRDPRDNWASLKSGWDKQYQYFNDDIQRLKQSMIERGLLGMQMAKYNQETIRPEQYQVIKFEDLTQNPRETLQSVAEFLGITFENSWLRPSILGYPWGGNNFEGKKFQEASSENVNKWKSRISDEDAQLIEFHYRDMMEHFGYEMVFSLKEAQVAASNHYKWFNFSTPFSAK